MDDRTVGLVLRALRRRRGWRQLDLATKAGCSQGLVSAVERGQLVQVSVERLRSVFGAVDARLLLEPRWRGAELDRLLDADHAAIVEAVARRLDRAGWEASIEITYAVGGERGSIDVLGLDPVRRAALVVEVKSDIAAAEAVGRKLDEKGRLAARIVRDRFGWTPSSVAVVLVMPESPRLRRLLGGPAASLARMLPIDGRAIAEWLRTPAGPLAATWFLSNIRLGNARRVRAPNRGLRRGLAAHTEVILSVNADESEPPTRILR